MAPTAETVTLGKMVPIGTLFASPLNPRKKFTPASLVDLAANIQKRGEVIVPLILRSNKKGDKFEIIDGERRFRAATSAGLAQLPAIFRDDLTDGEVIEIQLLSAIQRQDLTPLEEAGGYKALIDSNPSHYSAAYIGDRIGRTEKYVVDRMRLVHLIPELKTLLEAERILVGHAELLCRLKPEDQTRAITPNQQWRSGKEGLWQSETLLWSDDTEPDQQPSIKNLFRGMKHVTVKELEAWIAHHVRFDVGHAATVAPLDFGPVAQQVEEAAAQPGRGKKVIAITHDYRVDDDAKDPSERTYGSPSWERADGQAKSKTCEHSVLGVVAAGRGYGSTLQVCVARDKCAVHFGKVIKEKEKNTKLRQSGQGGQAAQREQKAKEQDERRRAAEAAERQAWDALKPKAIAAIESHIQKQPFTKVFRAVADRYAKGAKNPDQLIRSLAINMVTNSTHYLPYFERDTKRFGFDLKQWIVDNKPKPEAAAPVKAAKKKAKKR